MNYEYDRENDVLLITLREGKPDHGEQEDGVITHYDREGRPVQLEILDASEAALGMIREMLPQRASRA